MPHPISYFARTNARNDRRLFGIRQADRLFHMHVIGKTGVGKTTLLETLIRQDIAAGHGFALIDPHGDLAERVVRSVPPSRRDDLVYLNVPDPQQPYGYNPLRPVRGDKVTLAASGILEAFKKHWSDAWGTRMEHVLRNALFALIEHGGATLTDVLRLLHDDEYRSAVAGRIANPRVRAFWTTEYPGYGSRRSEMVGPIENKVGALLTDPLLCRILCGGLPPISPRRIMDQSGILIVNLARGRIGHDSAELLGSLLVTTIGLAGFSRADMPEDERLPFFLYIDEFQAMTTGSVAGMVSELRKYAVGLVLAHQHLDQLAEDVRVAVMGNVGTTIAFRVGARDAALLSREFVGFEPADFTSLPNHDMLLRLMIDEAVSRAFSATGVRVDDLDRAAQCYG